MKKSLLLGIMLSFGILSRAGTAASGTEIYADGYKATVLDDGTVAITWIYNSGEVTIPSEITDNATSSTGTYQVSAVGDGSYAVANDDITSLVLSEGITSIGASAFWGKTCLTTLSLPSTLTSIGGYAFENCTGLTSIRLAAVEAPSLGDDVFKTNTTDADWDYIGQNCVVYVPAGTASKYKGTGTWTYWDSFYYVLEPGTVTTGDDGYATYYNWYGYNVPEGVTAYAVITAESGSAKLVEAYQSGAEVAKTTGVILKGDANTTYTFDLLPFASAEAPEGNLLKGVHDAATITAEDGDCYYYKLAKGDKGLGFYWGATDGGVFALAANKAYLSLTQSQSSGAKFVGFFDATGITAAEAIDTAARDEIYTITGMKVKAMKSALSKGLYIINGKKTIVR